MKKALVIIDIQNDYFSGGAMELAGAEEAALKAKSVLEHFRKEGNLVIHIQHIAIQPEATFFIPDTQGAEIHESVKPLASEKVIIKHFPNSFRDTGLEEYLKENGVTHLVIQGMMTHVCIDATTKAAKDLEFDCTIIGDACATRDLEIQNKKVKAEDVQYALLAALEFFYAKIINADEYINS